MEAFKNVDSQNLRKVFRSDGQSDWLKWRSGEGREAVGVQKTSQYKRARHAPVFPKIGTNTAPEDFSNLGVGEHEEVLVPENVAKKKHRHWRETMAEKEAEKQAQKEVEKVADFSVEPPLYVEVDPSEDSTERAEKTEQSSLPFGWHEMTEPDTGRVYYFCQVTGEIKDSLENISLATKDFIEASSYIGRKQGYVFKLDIHGLGYYKDLISDGEQYREADSLVENDPMIGTTYQPLDKKEPVINITTSSKALDKRKVEYGTQLMEMVAQSLASNAKFRNANQTSPRQVELVACENTPIGRLEPIQKNTASLPPRPPPIEWELKRDPLTRRKYYFNPITKETRWENSKQ